MVAFNISDRDIDALSRIAYAEARNIASRTGNLKAAYGSVVDSILNRAAADKSYLGGSRIQDVIDHTNHPQYYQFTPIAGTRNKTWSDLPKPPAEVYKTVKSHLRDVQTGKGNLVGDATHYLNPNVRGTEHARSTWASDWASWPSVGTGTVQHRFGNPDDLTVPDYDASYEPPVGFPAPPAPASNDPAAQYAYAGLTRSMAPAMPVDRNFQTPDAVYGKMADTMGAAGIKGLGDARSTYAAPAGVVERGPAPPISLPPVPAGAVERSSLPSPQDMTAAKAKAYGEYGASRMAASKMSPEEAYFGPPASIPTAPAAIDPVTVQANAAPGIPPAMAGRGTLTVPSMADNTPAAPGFPAPPQQTGFPAPPPAPGRQARRSAGRGALVGGLTGGLPGAILGGLLGPAREQITGNIRSNRQGMGRVPIFSGVRNAYRGMFGNSRLGGLQSPPQYASPYSVGSGYGAIGSTFGGPPGATAYSRSNPSISFTSLGNGLVSRTNKDTGVSYTMAPGDYNAGNNRSGKSGKK